MRLNLYVHIQYAHNTVCLLLTTNNSYSQYAHKHQHKSIKVKIALCKAGRYAQEKKKSKQTVRKEKKTKHWVFFSHCFSGCKFIKYFPLSQYVLFFYVTKAFWYRQWQMMQFDFRTTMLKWFYKLHWGEDARNPFPTLRQFFLSFPLSLLLRVYLVPGVTCFGFLGFLSWVPLELVSYPLLVH